MRAIDYQEHNAKVRAVWEAYHRGQPARVPMIVGTNVRFTAFGHAANPRRIDFEQYFGDPEIMLTRQLEHFSWARHHVPQDAEMGLPEAWDVHVDFQNSYEAGWLGCPLRYLEGEVPDTLPLLQRDDCKNLLFDRGIPDPFAGGLMQRNWEYFAYFKRRQEEGFTWQGRPLGAVWPTGLGTDGPVTVACNLRGASEFYLDLAEDPDYACRLMRFITEATVLRIKAYRERLGLPAPQGLHFADDAIQSVSIATYRELVLPFHHQLVESLSTPGPNGIHLCGDATRFFRLLRDELAVRTFDTGYPIDFGWVRQQVGTEVEIKGGPAVPLLQTGSPSQVREEVRRILSSGITEGGRFVLREANNLAPGVSLENLWAMYAAVEEFGRYA